MRGPSTAVVRPGLGLTCRSSTQRYPTRRSSGCHLHSESKQGTSCPEVDGAQGDAADEKNLARTIARYGRVDLLMIDELGYMELDRRGAELLLHVLTEREANSSIAVASNESFSRWTKTCTDPRLCAAIVDRLAFGGTIIETGTDSYRLGHTHRQHQHATS